MAGHSGADEEAEERELEAAGWERVERWGEGSGETAWRNPQSGLVYPQGVAIALVREGADLGEPPGGPGGEA